MFAVLFLIFALVWHWQMSDVYFVSHEKGVIADFVPPFVHEGVSGDFFIKPRRVIYTIWAVYFGAVLVIPAVCAWLLVRLHQKELNKAWM